MLLLWTSLLILLTGDMFNKAFLLVGFCFVFFFSIGQEKKARDIAEILCSDSLYGRGYVNNGVNKAANFLEREFKKTGLVPFFGDTSYFQNFKFDVNTFPGEIGVVSDDYFFIPGADFIVDENSGSYHGPLFLVEVDTSVLLQPQLFESVIKEVRSGKKNGFYINLLGVSEKEIHKLIYQFNSLAALGPVIYVVNHKFTWSVGRRQMKFPVLYFKPEKISSNSLLSINISAKYIKDFPNKNVVGYLPAKKKNAKTIVFTAHYDHLGVMGTIPQITYFPGGNDNASGTAMLISLADYFVKQQRKYNLIFIAFAGEEAGLLGSEYFVNSGAIDLSKVKFLINLDIMGSGEEGITVVNGYIHKKQFKLLQKINKKSKYLTQIKPRGETANSDHYFFHKKGVPSFFIYTMGPNKNYHDIFDTYENLSFSAYSDIVKLLIEWVEKM